jgi:hypothetical protein
MGSAVELRTDYSAQGLAEAPRATTSDHVHRNEALGTCRSIVMTAGIIVSVERVDACRIIETTELLGT